YRSVRWRIFRLMSCLLVSPKLRIRAHLQTVPATLRLALAMGALGCESASASGPGAGGASSGAVGTQANTAAASNTAAGTTGSNTTGGAEGCPAGAVMCDGACANLSLNVYHCGSCGNACEDGQA